MELVIYWSTRMTLNLMLDFGEHSGIVLSSEMIWL